MGTKRNSINDPKLGNLMHGITALLTKMDQSQSIFVKWLSDNTEAFSDADINPSTANVMAENQNSFHDELNNIINTFYDQISQEDLPDDNAS